MFYFLALLTLPETGCWDPHSHLPFTPPPQDGDKVSVPWWWHSFLSKWKWNNEGYGPWSQRVTQIPAPPPTTWVRLWAVHWILPCLSFLFGELEIITVSTRSQVVTGMKNINIGKTPKRRLPYSIHAFTLPGIISAVVLTQCCFVGFVLLRDILIHFIVYLITKKASLSL